MKKFILACLSVLSMGLLFAMPAGAAACRPDPANNVYCCGTTQTSVDFKCQADDPRKPGVNSTTSLILTVINFMAIGVGIAVVGGIVWGSLWYITANGNVSQAQQGISIIINAVIGLVLFTFLWSLVNFLVPGGVLS